MTPSATCSPSEQAGLTKTADRRAEFDRLVRRYHGPAYKVAYRMTGSSADAEDLTQEAFVRAFRAYGSYRPDQPFNRWLYKIMSNLFLDRLRRRPKVPLLSLDHRAGPSEGGEDAVLEVPDVAADPERIVMSRELNEGIQRALDSLPPLFRLTVVLSDIEGLSYEQISATLGCAPGTVRSRLHRGRALLRARITASEHQGARPNLFPRYVGRPSSRGAPGYSLGRERSCVS